MSIKINGSNISQMRINGYDIKLAKINGSIVFEKVKLVKTFYGDSMQTSTTGKNKFNYNYYFDNYINNGNEYGSYPCLLTLTPNTQYIVSTNNNLTDVSGGIFANVFAWGGSDTSVTPGTINQGVMLNYPRIITTVNNGNLIIAIRTTEVSKSFFENGTVWVQIEEGSTATEYEPYTGGQPSPNPDYPQEIKSIISANLKLVGKNMLDFTDAYGAWQVDNITDGVVTTKTLTEWGGITLKVKPVELKAGQTYYISLDAKKLSGDYTKGVNNINISDFFDTPLSSTRTPISRPNFTDDYVRSVFKCIPSNDCILENLFIQRDGADTNELVMQVKNIMISTSTDYTYEPYKTGTIPINLQGNILSKVGDYADELQVYSNGDVKLVKKIREYTVTGEENFTNTYNTNAFDAQLLFNSTGFISGLGLCNYYKYNSTQSNVAVTLIHGEFGLQHYIDYEGDYGSFNLFFKNTNYNNATNFKNHLAELYSADTPVKVYYPLLNPTTIELPSIKSDLDEFGEYSSMNVEVTYG